MRNVIVPLLLLVITAEARAQALSGMFTNPSSDTIVLQYPGRYGLTSKHDTMRIMPDGSFTFQVHFDTPNTQATLESAGRRLPVWLAANEKLVIHLKDSVSYAVFAGPLARINEYLQVQDRYSRDLYRSYISRHPAFTTPAFAFSDKYFRINDSITNDRLSFLKQYFSDIKNRYEHDFINIKENELIYQNLFYKISYENPPLEKLRYYQINFNRPGADTFAYSDLISFNNPALLTNPFFLRFSRAFFMELVFRFQREAHIKLSKEAFYDKVFSYINQLSGKPVCNAVLKASFINDEVNSMVLDEKNTVHTYSRFIDSLLNYPEITEEANFIQSNFFKRAKQLLALNNGAMAPASTFTDSAGHAFSLSSYNGKLLYIDVWASWCGKCIEEIPNWNALVSHYKDNPNIAFISISTDKMEDRERWLQLLRKHQPKGRHFLSAGGAESEFAQKFLVNSYPRYILIGRSGQIIDLDAQGPAAIDLSKWVE